MAKFSKLTMSLAVVAVVALPNLGFAGSTVGGQPSNGGGTTFGTPSPSLSSVLGGEAVAEAIATGDPAQIEQAILAALELNYPGGNADLSPMDGLSGPQTVALLVNLIEQFADAVGLRRDSPAIVALLQLAQTAIA